MHDLKEKNKEKNGVTLATGINVTIAFFERTLSIFSICRQMIHYKPIFSIYTFKNII